MKTELFREANELVIKSLDDKRIPWHSDHGFPRNILSRQRYDGYNALLLITATGFSNFKSRFWGSKEQWEILGGKIRPGCVPAQIIAYRHGFFNLRGDLERRSVYNLDQIEGDFASSRAPLPAANYREVEKIIANTRADIHYTDEQIAMYYPPGTSDGNKENAAGDFVKMVRMDHFVRGPSGLNGYYHCILHETVGHWTEPGARCGFCDAPEVNELRAEMASDFMCTELMIPSYPYETRVHHHKHIAIWEQTIKEHPKLLWKVAISAAKGVDFVLACSDKAENRHDITKEI